MADTLKPVTAFELRDRLHSAIVRDLLGPAQGETEIVDEANVRGRYIIGMLAPRGQTPLPPDSSADGADEALEAALEAAPEAAAEEEEDLAYAGMDTEDGQAEPARPRAASMLPSAMGLTFTLAPEARFLRVTARWGRYQRIEREAAGLPPGAHNAWQRQPVEGVSPLIPLRAGRMPTWTPAAESPDVVVEGRIRKYDHGWTVTLYLVNQQRESRRNRDTAWLFQPQLTVTAHLDDDTPQPLFRRVLAVNESAEHLSAEERRLRMLHRRQVEFATGHNVAVSATLAAGRFDAAIALRTEVAPVFEVWPTQARPAPGAQMEMGALAAMSDAEFGPALQPMLDAYAAWIAEREREVAQPAPDLLPWLDVAGDNLRACRDALRRMQEGLRVIQSNPQAAEAFRFANRAMRMQRLRTEYARRARKGETSAPFSEFQPAHPPAWRPFQMAFILLNIASLTDPAHPDRNTIADVLWFATGGGKTEAYLGLTAFALGIRRLQGRMGDYDGSAGVTVLMRYTLRLLTLQQFQRATALICACEEIRRADPARWGDEPFRIGLWVGQASTPNTTAESSEKAQYIRSSGGHAPGGGTPHQLTACPYCGKPIRPGEDIVVETYPQGSARTLVYCGDPLGDCLFSRRRSPGEGLPVVVVDEEVYRRLPALLIATVDKFAQLPWKGETQMLFGRVNGRCSRHGFRSPEIEDADTHPKSRQGLPPARTEPAGPLRPPDLIIQDELHLINGPLGTLVGLYETAIDALSTWTWGDVTVKPKLIASSATIRRAEAQVAALYTREARIFPPPGLEAGDSFFAFQAPPSPEAPGRRYLGLCAPGTTMRAFLIRVYVACMAAAQQLFETHGEIADPWMTLVGYFNSLRELGRMRRATEDSVISRLQRMDQRGLARRRVTQMGVQELTSRRSAAEIPFILDKLEVPFTRSRPQPDKDEPPSDEQTAAEKTERLYPIDVLLATNMISVGVDVDRLGLMVVANQPKNTAEYIQATSRIGRRFPGLVCAAYNWSRPRDLSHYERFEHYHSTFYQQVEALSVTPFSPRALDRGLAALLVAMVRLAGDEFNPNEKAGQIAPDHPQVRQAVDLICARAAQATGNPGSAAAVREMLERRVRVWARLAARQREAGARLGYKAKHDNVTTPLLKSAEAQSPGGRDLFTCLNSLRDVEPTVNLILQEYESDDEQYP